MRKQSAKTRLIQAFFTLIKHKHYSRISVSDLIVEANVSRTTFYRHYADVYDMYEKICLEMVNKMLEDFLEVFRQEGIVLTVLFDVFCEKLESQRKYIQLLCGKNGDRKFFEIGINAALSHADSFYPYITESERFLIKFVVFSCAGGYVKALMDEVEFDKKHLELYRRMLFYAQKAGESNE